MKKFPSKHTKLFAILLSVSLLFVVIGVILIPIPSLSSDLKIFCFGLGIPFSIVFLTVYLANRSRYILIDDEKIVCSRGATVITQNGEQQRKFDRTTLAYNDICNVKRDIIKGVKIIADDTLLYRFVLSNGKKIEVPFYEYGPNAENELKVALEQRGIEIIN